MTVTLVQCIPENGIVFLATRRFRGLPQITHVGTVIWSGSGAQTVFFHNGTIFTTLANGIRTHGSMAEVNMSKTLIVSFRRLDTYSMYLVSQSPNSMKAELNTIFIPSNLNKIFSGSDSGSGRDEDVATSALRNLER